MNVRWQLMGTSQGAWIEDLEMLREAGREDQISLVEMALTNGSTIIVEEVIDGLTKDSVTSHLEVRIAPHDTAPLDVRLSPVVVQYP